VRYTAAQGLRRLSSGEKLRLRRTAEVHRGDLGGSAQTVVRRPCAKIVTQRFATIFNVIKKKGPGFVLIFKIDIFDQWHIFRD